jgi:hypothetical protein
MPSDFSLAPGFHGVIKTARVRCPYCGERLSLTVDGSVEYQDYIEDCHVCCRPINLAVRVDDGGAVSVTAQRDDE